MTDIKSKLCFIVGPIGTKGSPDRKRSDLVRRFLIDPAMSGFPEFHVERADEIGKPGMIDGQIISRLRDADLVIADLATSNPNAFYEIGIRHMAAKPIVHMYQSAERIPFDLSVFSAVAYEMDSIEEIDAAVQLLTKHVAQAVDPEHDVDNPVTRALGREKFDPKALPSSDLILAEIESIRNSIAPILREHQVKKNIEIANLIAGRPSSADAASAIMSKRLADAMKKVLNSQTPQSMGLLAGLANLQEESAENNDMSLLKLGEIYGKPEDSKPASKP